MIEKILFLLLLIFIIYIIFEEHYININSDSVRVHIWQAEWSSNTLHFMYKPIISSIIELLKYSNNNININYKIDYSHNFEDIKENEILIWIGCINIPDFDYLRSKKIYTIYYNTEPDTNKYSSDEIWTYSKYLFINYNKHFDEQKIKFIPIILEENVPFVPYNLSNNNIKLSFIGQILFRNGKSEIIFNDKLLIDKIETTNNLWSDETYNNYITSNSNIYLNLTKNGTFALPSVRINKLLSHKCIIISEHTNDIDEEYYKDIVYFCNIDDIGKVYNNLLKKTNIELQNKANEIYENFYNKFYYKNVYKLIEEK